MARRPTKTIKIDENIEHYIGFFDHKWVNELFVIIKDTRMENPILNLTSEWKGISNARQLPWLMMHGLKDSIDEALNSHTPFPLRTLHVLLERISNGAEHQQLNISDQNRQIVISEIRKIENEIIEAIRLKPYNGDLDKIWKAYVESSDVRIGLWMSEVNAFAGVYFAYEHFLISTIKMIGNLPFLRTNKLAEEMAKYLGKAVVITCWDDEQVNLARCIRNAVVHNGRKVTKELEQYRKNIDINDGEIALTAYQTTALFNMLKKRVSIICKEVIKYEST